MSALSVREYNPETDAEVVSSWWEQRHGKPMQLALLPPIGVVVEDEGGRLCALWLYLSAGIGVGFLENPVAVVGLTPKQSGEAFAVALAALEAVALTHDYGVLVCHTPAGIARLLGKQGFVFSDRPVFTGEKLIRKATS